MFKLIRTPLETICSKASRSFRNKANRRIDPGIGYRKKLLSEKQESEPCTDYDDLESDFSNVNKSHKEHFMEIEAFREKEKYLIVRQKYFTEKYPNFLTWADKQQIKFLHQKDPEQWSVHKLSEGFPALPDVIQKIVKTNWTKNPNRIKNHDYNVVQNWTQFKNGELNLPPHLSDHINRFTDRKLNIHSEELSKEKLPTISLPRGEFSEIVDGYGQIKPQLPQTINPQPCKDTYLDNEKSHFQEPMTFKAYRGELEKKVKDGGAVSLIDEEILKQCSDKEPMQCEEIELKVAQTINSDGDLTTYSTKKEKDYTDLYYPDKIIIPKDKLKRGCTYKLNDCYYDDDGDFLYRVPGME